MTATAIYMHGIANSGVKKEQRDPQGCRLPTTVVTASARTASTEHINVMYELVGLG